MANLTKYGSYDIEAAIEEGEELERGDGKYMKLTEGRHVVRFLPPPVGRNSPFVIVYQHFIPAGPGMKKGASFACPRLMAPKGQPRACVVCKRMEELKASPNRADQEMAEEIAANRRVFANVIDRGHPDLGVRILAFGKTIHQELVKIRQDPASGGDFTDPGPDGFDIVIERTGTKREDTKYAVRPSRGSSALGNMDWIDQQPDLLNEVAVVPSDDEINQILGLAPGQPQGRRRRTAEDDAQGDA